MATQNAKRITKEGESYTSPTVDRFLEEKSIPARVGQRRGRKQALQNNPKRFEQGTTNENSPFEDPENLGQEEQDVKSGTSFIGGQAKFRVALVLCAIFAGAQCTFALMATGTLLLLPISFVLWLIACMCSLAGFIAIRMWLGVSVFDNPGLAISTVCCVVLSCIPGLNIIPWMCMWTWGIRLTGNIQ